MSSYPGRRFFRVLAFGIREDFLACEKMVLLFVYLAVSPPVCLLPIMNELALMRYLGFLQVKRKSQKTDSHAWTVTNIITIWNFPDNPNQSDHGRGKFFPARGSGNGGQRCSKRTVPAEEKGRRIKVQNGGISLDESSRNKVPSECRFN